VRAGRAALDGINRLGAKVVREMNRLGMMVDVSHVSDATFFAVLSDDRTGHLLAQLAARAVPAPAQRHRRHAARDRRERRHGDDQLQLRLPSTRTTRRSSSAREATRRIQEKAAREKFAAGSSELRDALANLDAASRRSNGRSSRALVAHVLRAIEIAGPDHVGLGSDFDGVPCVPQGMDDATSCRAHLRAARCGPERDDGAQGARREPAARVHRRGAESPSACRHRARDQR
jgi:membrane dipeptidase